MALSTTTIMLIATGAGILATILSVVVVIFAYFYVRLNNRINEIERLVTMKQQIQSGEIQPIVRGPDKIIKGGKVVYDRDAVYGKEISEQKSDSSDLLDAMNERIDKAIAVSEEYHQSRDIAQPVKDPKEVYIEKMDKRVANATAFLKENGLDRVEVAPTAEIKPDSLLKLRKISTESRPADPLAGSVDDVYDSIMKPKQAPAAPRKARIISYKGDKENGRV